MQNIEKIRPRKGPRPLPLDLPMVRMGQMEYTELPVVKTVFTSQNKK